MSVVSEVFSMFIDATVSDGSDLLKDKIKGVLRARKLAEFLDQYDKQFAKKYDSEISLDNLDLESIQEKRKVIITIARKCINQETIDIKVNRKKQFLAEAGQIVGNKSSTAKKYLDGFYDLSFLKESCDSARGDRALFNSLADQICEEFKIINRRVGNLENKVEKLENRPEESVDFTVYYEFVEKRFTRKKTEEEAELVGDFSDEEAYIEANIINGRQTVPVLSYLEEWFCKETFGTLLLYGEPGHGKTMVCNKAVVDHFRGTFLRAATNVLCISLNTGENCKIIQNGQVEIKEALVWGENHRFSFENCRGSLLFLDGFDEFIDDAKDTDISNIAKFMKFVGRIADEYDIHIVVLSRTIAIQEFLCEKPLAGRSFMLTTLTDEQQDTWLNEHEEYTAYRRIFWTVRENNNMRPLLGIPFLFRLIVHSRFDQISTNVVELYDKLIEHLMAKRNIYGKDLEIVEKRLRNLSYDIYSNNTVTTDMDVNENHWSIVFYIKQYEKGIVGFFHRSFYQYFLAKFIYFGIINLNNENAETFSLNHKSYGMVRYGYTPSCSHQTA